MTFLWGHVARFTSVFVAGNRQVDEENNHLPRQASKVRLNSQKNRNEAENLAFTLTTMALACGALRASGTTPVQAGHVPKSLPFAIICDSGSTKKLGYRASVKINRAVALAEWRGIGGQIRRPCRDEFKSV